MKLTQAELNYLYLEEEVETSEGITLKTVEEGEFEQDHKHQVAEIVFTDGKNFYRGFVSRSGSPFTDWEWDDWGDADIVKVEKKEVVVTQWVPVKEDE